MTATGQASPAAPGADVVVGDHRLLRRLGGARATVWLAAPLDVEDGERVAIKLAAPGTDPATMLQEAEVLWRGRGRHVVRVLESLPGGLVLEHIPIAAADAVAAGLAPGAAVTLLAPIAAELGRLHAAGAVHGGIRLGALGLRESGEPVLFAFGAARIPAPTELPAAAAADVRAFQAVAMTVLAATTGPASPAWIELRRWLAAAEPEASAWLTSFVDRLFAAAGPEPVPLPSRPEFAGPEHSGATADRVGRAGAVAAEEIPRRDTRSTAFARWRERLRAWPRRMRPSSGARIRPRIWVPIAAAGLALAVAAIALTGKPDAAGAGTAAAGPSGVAAESPLSSVSPSPGSDASGAGEPGSDASGSATSPAASDAPTTAAGDAALSLLTTRERCYRELSLDCLTTVVEPGSDAEAIDAAAIVDLGEGGGALPATAAPVSAAEVQRLGDAAIVDVLTSEGAIQRLLVMLTPDGWRIRAYLDAP